MRFVVRRKQDNFMYIICHSVGTQEIYVFPSLFSIIFAYLAFSFLAVPRGVWDFPDQGWNSWPLQWELGVLTTGPPGKSSSTFFFSSVFWPVNQAKGAE